MGVVAPMPPVPPVPPPMGPLKSSDYVQAVIEVTHKRLPVKEFGPANFPFMEHKWGRTAGFLELVDGKEIFMQVHRFESVEEARQGRAGDYCQVTPGSIR